RRSGPHAQRRPTTVRDPARSQRRLTNPSKGLVFPVSALILERIAPYRTTLDAFSKPRWLTSTGTRHRATNVIVAHTIEHTLAEQVDCLRKHDAFVTFVESRLDMPAPLIGLLI